MNRLTNNQLLHREYLKSPLWKDIRGKVLEQFGEICAKCGEHGTDVHHLTYERVGGNELIEDLQVLCRECHEATHAIEKNTHVDKNGKKSCSAQKLYALLSDKQKRIIEQECGGNAYSLIISPEKYGESARKMAMKMLKIHTIDDHYLLQCKIHLPNKRSAEFLKHLKVAKKQGKNIKSFRKQYFSID